MDKHVNRHFANEDVRMVFLVQEKRHVIRGPFTAADAEAEPRFSGSGIWVFVKCLLHLLLQRSPPNFAACALQSS